jgi:hypothetical protein
MKEGLDEPANPSSSRETARRNEEDANDRAKRGGRVPPRRDTPRANKTVVTLRAAAPPTRGLRPLVHPRSERSSSHTIFFVTEALWKITLAEIPTVRLKMILFCVHPVGRFSLDRHWPLFT